MANRPQYNYLDIGIAGEDLVAQWLQSKGWRILHRRWRYRRGEIDIIAQYDGEGAWEENCFPTPPHPYTLTPLLTFVEVKTRSPESWDAGGRSAITPQKQTKLWRTALMFLAKYPDKAEYSCRFDVACVCCQEISKELSIVEISQQYLASSLLEGYQFVLEEYIPGAFDCQTN
ncbi:MAG: YraN family protein [Scytonema sp. PMC 1069.18]|nr:YraN family protein [Scytonema sp. PMC 1069.18]MEC4885671.1 YraN family protein [Scytonema sp. PMC 1070.18]